MRNGHGNDIYDFNREIAADFSSNIPYKNHSEEIIEFLSGRMHVLQNYPDPESKKLVELIATHHNISPVNILTTNGSAEAFYLTAHLFSGKKTTITYPSFAEYEDACRVHNHQLSFLPIEDLEKGDNQFEDSLWFAVPNNPNGYILSSKHIKYICKENPQTHIIIDNAYGELCPHAPSVFPLHQEFNNLISIHSLTKTFAVPGLRIGYIIADKDIIAKLKNLQTPWSVNALAIEAGCFVMKNYERLLPDSTAVCRESKLFQQQLCEIPLLEVTPSECNYFLVKSKTKTAARLKLELMEKYGILIRNADNFRGLTPWHFRLSVQSAENNRLLVEALRQIE